MERGLRLRDCLSVPYLLAAETVEVAPGSWISRVAYPELSDCGAEAPVVEDALRLLERRRIEIIIRMVEQGNVPPRPRPPLGGCDPGSTGARGSDGQCLRASGRADDVRAQRRLRIALRLSRLEI